MDYKKAYALLFNAITMALDNLDNSRVIDSKSVTAVSILKQAQHDTEEMYISDESEDD